MPLKIDEILHQKLANFYAENHHLPPLASNIYAYLTFDFQMQGISFEEFVVVFKASKSSISSNLQLLQAGEFIISRNKLDARKRFFIINPDYVKIRFQNLIQKLEKEKDILEHLKIFRLENDGEQESLHYITKLDNYITLLDANIGNLSQTINKLCH